MGTWDHSKQSLQSHIFTWGLTYSFTLKLHQTLQTLCHPHTISTDLFATHLPKTSKCHPTSNLLSLTQASTTTHMQVAVELATISRPQRPPTAALLAALPLSLSTVSQRASPSSAAAEAEQATGLLLAQRHLARTPPALQTAMAAYEVDSSAFHHHHGRHQSSGLVLIPTSFDNDISSSRRNIETSEKSDRRMHRHHHHQHGVHL